MENLTLILLIKINFNTIRVGPKDIMNVSYHQ